MFLEFYSRESGCFIVYIIIRIHLFGADGDPDRWKWTFCHFPPTFFQSRVSSDLIVRGSPSL